MGYRVFDRRRLKLKPLEERVHDFNVSQVLSLSDETPPFEDRRIAEIARRIVDARSRGSQVIFMMGAHVIKVGLSRFVIELMKKGMVTHVAGNGAVAIHDFELSLIGATTESVAKYIRTGEFGLWKETGMINDIAREAAEEGIGFGEAIGRAIEEGDFPYKDISILATGYRLGIPVTIHVGIGYDIIHEHPNCDGAALGAASYMDFLIFAASIEGLEGGVFLNYGSAVMGPEVYLKALSMARNVARSEGREIAHFTTAVFDLIPLGEDLEREAPKDDWRYYYRPYKTILVRTVADGGESFYICGDHRATLPALYREIMAAIS
jgi:hypothetical protein